MDGLSLSILPLCGACSNIYDFPCLTGVENNLYLDLFSAPNICSCIINSHGWAKEEIGGRKDMQENFDLGNTLSIMGYLAPLGNSLTDKTYCQKSQPKSNISQALHPVTILQIEHYLLNWQGRKPEWEANIKVQAKSKKESYRTIRQIQTQKRTRQPTIPPVLPLYQGFPMFFTKGGNRCRFLLQSSRNRIWWSTETD